MWTRQAWRTAVLLALVAVHYSSDASASVDYLSPAMLIQLDNDPVNGANDPVNGANDAVEVDPAAIKVQEHHETLPVRMVAELAQNLQGANAKLQEQVRDLEAEKALHDTQHPQHDDDHDEAHSDEAHPDEAHHDEAHNDEAHEDTPLEALPLPVKLALELSDRYKDRIASQKAEITHLEQELAAENQKNEERELNHEKEEEHAHEETQEIKYHEIPFFEFSAGSQTVPAQQEEECRAICDKQPECKSFSWSQKKRLCMWSVDAIQYDDAFTLYAKSARGGAARWSPFPGLKFLTSGAVTERHRNIELEECQDICLKAPLCRSISYRSNNRFCTTSEGGLSYNNAFIYFEKEVETHGAKDAVEHNAEVKIEHDFEVEEAHEKQKETESNSDDVQEEDRKHELIEEMKKSMLPNDRADSVEANVEQQIREEEVHVATISKSESHGHLDAMLKQVEEIHAEMLQTAEASNAKKVMLEKERADADSTVDQLKLEHAMAKADLVKLDSKIKGFEGEIGVAQADIPSKQSLKTRVDKIQHADASAVISEAILDAEKNYKI